MHLRGGKFRMQPLVLFDTRTCFGKALCTCIRQVVVPVLASIGPLCVSL